MPSIFLENIVMLSVLMINFAMLSVVWLIAMAPYIAFHKEANATNESVIRYRNCGG